MDSATIEAIVSQVLQSLAAEPETAAMAEGIPVGISNRHIHLSTEHMEILFGCGSQLTRQKDLKQVGEFAAAETLTLVGPKGVLRNVRVLGPVRGTTQVEISSTDGFALGVKAPVRDSGSIEGSPGIILAGPCGAVTLGKGVICAARHIHMHNDDARRFGVKDGERVIVEVDGPRGADLKNVLVRVKDSFRLEMHIDTDEANALGIGPGATVTLRREQEA